MNDLADEIRGLFHAAAGKIEGAAEIISVPGVSARSADLAYNGVGDAVNLTTKGFLRRQGAVDLRGESATALLAKVFTMLRRAGLPSLPSESDLQTIVYQRNDSVHGGLVATNEVEEVRAAIALATEYLKVVRTATRI